MKILNNSFPCVGSHTTTTTRCQCPTTASTQTKLLLTTSTRIKLKYAHPFKREAKEELAKRIERIASGAEEPTAECSYKSRPQLTVSLPEATPEAFRMVLNYIYTDRIDPTEKGKVLLVL